MATATCWLFGSAAERRQFETDRPVLSPAPELLASGASWCPTADRVLIGTGLALPHDASSVRPALVILEQSATGLPTVAAVVLGTAEEYRPALRTAGCLLHHNGLVAGTGAPGVLAGNPVTALATAVAAIEPREGQADDQLVVLSSITPPVAGSAADRFSLAVAGFGSVRLRLVEEGAR